MRPAKLPICNGSDMIRNLGASDQIRLQGSQQGSHLDDLRLLETAFGERLAALGGRAVVLESLVKVVVESGFRVTEQQAAETLEEKMPAGTMFHADSCRSLVPASEGPNPQRPRNPEPVVLPVSGEFLSGLVDGGLSGTTLMRGVPRFQKVVLGDGRVFMSVPERL